MSEEGQGLDVLLTETRRFPPPENFGAGAVVPDRGLYESASADRLAFWESWAEKLDWFERWHTVLEWDPPHAKWFVGGKLNVSHNCLDRHLDGPRRNKAALIWEGEPGDVRVYTYWSLHREVCQFASALKDLGVGKGDRVAIYLPMIPEAAIAMLACTRIGAPHSVVFGGFSPESLADRVNDVGAKVLITADGGYRRGGIIPLKVNADKALESCTTVENVVVVARGADLTAQVAANMEAGRDHWYHELIAAASADCAPGGHGCRGSPIHPLHVRDDRKAEGRGAHYRWVFDPGRCDHAVCLRSEGGRCLLVHRRRRMGDGTQLHRLWPPSQRCHCPHVRGRADWPEKDRFWNLCEKYGVTVFYTAPTAIRAFMKWGEEWPDKHDLSKLRLLGSVGEPINPEAWMWYHRVLGKERCPIVDTWWQTETGAIMITPLPGVTETRPGSATHPFPGISVTLLDDVGNEVEAGFLAITEPWPSMLRTIYGDDERYRETYWSKWDGIYFAGDGAKRDDDGYLWLLGRVDDVLSVAGHRIGTMEVESALVDHPAVVEAAVVGKSHEVKGQAVAAFVTLKGGRRRGTTSWWN